MISERLSGKGKKEGMDRRRVTREGPSLSKTGKSPRLRRRVKNGEEEDGEEGEEDRKSGGGELSHEQFIQSLPPSLRVMFNDDGTVRAEKGQYTGYGH